MVEHRRERGATLVEYALLVSLVALAVVGAVDVLGPVLVDQYDRVADGTSGDRPTAPTSTTEADGPGPSPTSPATSTTTTTTTTSPPVVASVGFGGATSWPASWYRWRGAVPLSVTDARGRPVAGARVEARIVASDGTAQTVTLVSTAQGSATVEVGPYRSSWARGVGHVQVEIVGVSGDGTTWDGRRRVVTISEP